MKEHLKKLNKLRVRAVAVKSLTDEYVRHIESIMDIAGYLNDEDRNKFMKDASECVLTNHISELLKIDDL